VSARRRAAGARPPADGAELAALLTLLATPRLHQARVLTLLKRHGDARTALDMLAGECGDEIAALAHGTRTRRRVEHALHTIAAERITTIPVGSAGYPAVLLERLDEAAPPALFARGDMAALDPIGVGVVGCRAATEYGLDVAGDIAAAVARAGGCVISGLARGIDAAAHAGALEGGGATIAVLGCGVDVYYPQQNMKLQDRIAAAGLLLSEFLPGEGPRTYTFPHRNRIIAALSSAVVVVEAGLKSGANRTAEHAMGMHVPTYGVPNAIDRPNMEGILALYRDGVEPFTGTADLLVSVGLAPLGSGAHVKAAPEAPTPAGLHGRVWAALTQESTHVDAIAAAAGVDAGQVLAALLELELDGRVRQLPGARFTRGAPRHAVS
jgi:DNA processing protein